MTKTEAREAVEAIIAKLKPQADKPIFGKFVENVYFPYYTRKWKHSTCENNKQRMRTHLLGAINDRPLDSLLRDELQDFMDSKGNAGLSFSVVDHLRWDLKQIFDIAIAEGKVLRNPALLLFTPREAKRPIRKVLTVGEAQKVFSSLGMRERIIARLALLAGLRPGEIFGLKWGPSFRNIRRGKATSLPGYCGHPKNRSFMAQGCDSEWFAVGLHRMACEGSGYEGRCLGVSFGADDAFIEGQLLAEKYAPEAGKGWACMGKFPSHASHPCELNERAWG
jgi:hypothetical protein